MDSCVVIMLSLWQLFVSSSAVSIELELDASNVAGNGFYKINIGNDTWFESGQLEGYMNNAWYTTNSSKAKETGWSLIQLLSTSTLYNHFDDFGGWYDMTTYQWSADTVLFETKFKSYHDGKAISFIQSFPNGVSGTNLIDARQVVSNCNQDNEAPFLSFPSFNSVHENSLYSTNSLGFLTWTDQQIQNVYGRTPIQSAQFAGINGGVMVLYDNRSTAATVISPINHFSSFAQMNNNPAAIHVVNLYHETRNDYMTCIGLDCKTQHIQHEGYTDTSLPTLDGIAMSANITASCQQDEVIAVHLWFSSLTNDSCLSSLNLTHTAHASYSMRQQNIGYIYKSNDAHSSRLPFVMYYNKATHDHVMAASEHMRNLLLSKGFQALRVEGYIKNTSYTAESNTDWKMGSTATLLAVPQAYEQEIAIVVGSGVNDAMLKEWSSRVQSLYHTSKLPSEYDVATSYLGYWTDHGAYYYGDSYGYNLSCCSLQKLNATKQALDAQGIAIHYLQMDDWWYDGRSPREVDQNQWGGVKGVSHWQPPSQYFPKQLAGLTETLQVPLFLYGPYFDPDNDWIGEFDFTPIDAGYVLPVPDQSYSFYSTLFDFALNATATDSANTGFIAYEIDFMNCLSHTPVFRLYVDQQEQWLSGINKAAEERGLVVQYCMTVAMNLMMALSFSQTTNARGSHDYAASVNWNIGPSALLTQALAVKLSKDNFWTMFDEPVPPDYVLSGSDYNSTEIHALAAVLSGGPVGISDGAGYSNKTLVMRTCTHNGRLLQPSRSATAIDDQFRYRAFLDVEINVWATYFGPKNVNNLWRIVYAIDMEKSYDLTVDSLYPALNANFLYIVRNWHEYTHCANNSMAIENGCVMMANEKKDGFLYQLQPQQIQPPMLHSFELITITLASFDELVFVGELDKYVSASENRFSNLVIQQLSFSVDITGAPYESVFVTVLKPNDSQTDYIVLTFDVILPKSGFTTFALSL